MSAPGGHPIVLSPAEMTYIAGLLFVVLLVVVCAVLIARRMTRGKPSAEQKDWAPDQLNVENSSAFIAASMQGVIEKLRAQEKELARLHMVAQERAKESERLTEEVTRNMPTGLLLVNATGAIGSSNPAAEDALGVKSLRYRSYKEVLGAESGLAHMLEDCLREGKTFHRGEVEHITGDGEVRHLGVTISPIYRGARSAARLKAGSSSAAAIGEPETRANGALCLLSDLTELTALQKQIRWEENLASLGEMFAGIAQEFKNEIGRA